MCTCAEGYSTVGERAANRVRTVEAIRRKLVNPQVPSGKRERLCYELQRLGTQDDRQLAAMFAQWLGCRRREAEEERRMLCWFFRSRCAGRSIGGMA